MRSRNLKPSLFTNELLAIADPLYTIIFEGLWCAADREGRLEDRPAKIHMAINPGRAFEGTARSLDWLTENGFISRYSVARVGYIQITNFGEWCDIKTTESVNAAGGARRARKQRAIPLWANRKAIRAFYEKAASRSKATGQRWHVDHVIPLAGANVCGLHVENNLCVVTAEQNLRKSNKYN
jgi:hypothetical protein